MITWLPFYIINFALPFCSVCQRWPYISTHMLPLKLLQELTLHLMQVMYMPLAVC